MAGRIETDNDKPNIHINEIIISLYICWLVLALYCLYNNIVIM